MSWSVFHGKRHAVYDNEWPTMSAGLRFSHLSQPKWAAATKGTMPPSHRFVKIEAGHACIMPVGKRGENAWDNW